VNGAECEPYLTTDHRLMVEQPERVHFGLRIMLHALGVRRAIIGVENNKPDAIEALRRTAPKDLDVTVLGLEVKYPQGAEKILIESVLHRRVGSGKLPATAGVLVQNVASVASIGEVFETGLPLVERVLTVSGHGVKKPANLVVPVGTKYTDLLDACGGLTDDAAEVIHGGPMMGVAQHSLDVPVLKGTSGVVVVTRAEVRDQHSYPCIHCGRCLEACPMFLDPSRLGELARAGRYEEMEEAHLADCMLCGSCSFACPSNIPIAQLLAASKASLRRVKAGAA
jgi:electron transport complex protein RnfC